MIRYFFDYKIYDGEQRSICTRQILATPDSFASLRNSVGGMNSHISEYYMHRFLQKLLDLQMFLLFY